MARHKTLENARILVADRRRLHDEQTGFIRSETAFEQESSLAAAQREAAHWQSEKAQLQASVIHLESVVGKEAIRTERLKGCALTRRAHCIDLEKTAEHQSQHIQKLESSISAAEGRMSFNR